MLRLLTVDDEAHIHEGLDAIMDWASLGYEHAGSALNGQEALELARSVRPDVILTDIRMPGMNGLELIRSLRSEPGIDPVIIVISGHDDFGYARESMRYRVRDYLLKPIDEDELAALLEEIRERPAATAKPDERGSADTTAVQRMLHGDRSAETLALVEQTLDHAPDTRFVPVVISGLAESERIDNPLAPDAIRNALRSTKARISADLVVFDTPLSVAALLLVPAEEATPERMPLWFRGLHRSLQDSLRRDLVLHYVRAGDSVTEAAGRLATLRASMADHAPARPGAVVLHEQSENPAWHVAIAPEDLFAAVELQDNSHALRELDRVRERWLSAGVPARAIRDWITRLRLAVSATLRELGCDRAHLPDADGVTRVARFAEFVPPEIASAATEKFVREAIAAVSACVAMNRNTVVALIRRRIERRFADDLTLSGIADDYEMSPVYLGQLFRKVQGIGFRDCLRERRVREACRLLRDTDLHIPEVANAVGYRDADFFTDQFKRETGVPPGAYRARKAAERKKPR